MNERKLQKALRRGARVTDFFRSAKAELEKSNSELEVLAAEAEREADRLRSKASFAYAQRLDNKAVLSGLDKLLGEPE